MNDKPPPLLAELPECGVIGCPEMASPRGGQRGFVVTIAGAGQRLQVQTWAYTCAKHAQELTRLGQAEAPVR